MTSSLDYYQVCIADRSNSVCFQSLRLLKKYEVENSNSEVNKVLKMVASDHISRILKGIMEKDRRETNFIYRVFEILSKRIPKLSLQDIM